MSNNIFHEEGLLTNSFSLKKLFSSSRDVDYQNSEGWTLLFELISKNENENLKTTISLNANINIRDKKGKNALYWAIFYKNTEAIKILLNANIDLYVTPTLSAIHFAIYKDDVKSLKALKNSGMDINYFDDINATPLIYAVLYNKIHCINYLLNNGANINQTDVLGNSALSLAKDLKINSFLSKFKV